MIKQTALIGILVLFIAFLLIGCASTANDTLAEPSSSQSGAPVPGEKTPDDERYGAGPMGSSNVRF